MRKNYTLKNLNDKQSEVTLLHLHTIRELKLIASLILLPRTYNLYLMHIEQTNPQIQHDKLASISAFSKNGILNSEFLFTNNSIIEFIYNYKLNRDRF